MIKVLNSPNEKDDIMIIDDVGRVIYVNMNDYDELVAKILDYKKYTQVNIYTLREVARLIMLGTRILNKSVIIDLIAKIHFPLETDKEIIEKLHDHSLTDTQICEFILDILSDIIPDIEELENYDNLISYMENKNG